MGRIFAGVLGSLAFLVCLAQGLIHDRSADATVATALLALWAFAAVGWVLGRLAQSTVEESATRQFANEMVRQQEAAKRGE